MELIVSMGVLVLLFALAGQVFNLTVQSTGQATALTEMNRFLRTFEQTLRDDLRHVEPGRSLILIQGNPVNAFWNQDGKDAAVSAGLKPDQPYPHVADPTREDANGNLIKPRADMLMFFTAREATSFAHRGKFAVPLAANIQQVVYGHAMLGEYVLGGGAYTFQPGPAAFPMNIGYPSPTIVSPAPAAQWHLARRSVLLSPTLMPAGTADALAAGSVARGLADPGVLAGGTDVDGNFVYDREVLQPFSFPGIWLGGNWYLPIIFQSCLDPQSAGFVKDMNVSPFARSRLDPTMPPQLGNRLGHYFLPNCASFKVEWALDRDSEFVNGRLDGMRELIWLDPGRFDPANVANENPLTPLREAERRAKTANNLVLADKLDTLRTRASLHPDELNSPVGYSLLDRFCGPLCVPGGAAGAAWNQLGQDAQGQPNRPNLAVFGASRLRFDLFGVKPPEIVEEDIFPSALRITIDLFDREGRFERPTRHVIVVPVGG